MTWTTCTVWIRARIVAVLSALAHCDFCFHFVRKTHAKFDFNNANQILADLFVAHGLIEDDNMDYFLPAVLTIKGEHYTVDKDNPGVYIYIMQ